MKPPEEPWGNAGRRNSAWRIVSTRLVQQGRRGKESALALPALAGVDGDEVRAAVRAATSAQLDGLAELGHQVALGFG